MKVGYTLTQFLLSLLSIVMIIAIGELGIRVSLPFLDHDFDPGTREAAWEKIHKKIRRGRSVSVLFLGDSTVRNAIVPDVFERMTGRSALNLGMVGDYGTYGNFVALQAYLDYHSAPEAVIFWHTLDVWNRLPMTHLQDYTRCQLSPVLDRQILTYRLARTTWREIPWWPVHQLESLYRIVAFCSAAYRYRPLVKDKIESYLALDPVASIELPVSERTPERNLALQEEAIRNTAPGISAENVYWLLQLRELAARNGIKLILARSPINENAVAHPETRAHLAVLNRALDTYFALAPDILQLMHKNPVFPAELFVSGDKDHANSHGAPKMTQFYARALMKAMELRQ